MRNPATVKSMLQQVYARKEAIDDFTVDSIIESAGHPAGHEAFTSILFSPKYSLSFGELLQRIKTIPVCQINGKDDPWIRPYWGQRIKRVLPQSNFIELSPCGHCPHHERPYEINALLKEWVSCVAVVVSSQGKDGDNAHDVRARALNARCQQLSSSSIACELVDGRPRNFVEQMLKLLHNVPTSITDGQMVCDLSSSA